MELTIGGLKFQVRFYCMASLALLIDMFSVSHLHNRDDKQFIYHFIYDAVCPLPNPVTFLP